MEPRRLILFVVLSLVIFVGWQKFVVPQFVPANQQAGQRQQDGRPAHQEEGPADGEDAAAPAEADKGVPGAVAAVNPPQKSDGEEEAKTVAEAAQDDEQAPADDAALPRHPHEVVVLGSLDPESGYFIEARTTSTGAALDYARLNDPRYKELRDPDAPNKPQEPLQVVGNNADGYRTLEISVERIDEQLEAFDRRLKDLDWKIESIDGEAPGRARPPHSSVTYSISSPDGTLQLLKRYSLRKLDVDGPLSEDVRDTNSSAYRVRLELTIRNLSQEPQEAEYVLQGPVGLPLENIEHTRTYRRVVAGTLQEGQKAVAPPERDIELVTRDADDIVEDAQANKFEQWQDPLKYVGVDVQYFAALLVPEADQLKTAYVVSAEPMLVERAREEKHSDISVRLTSKPLTLQPHGRPDSEVTHTYDLYAGPKRDALLEPLAATDIIDYGWFGFVSRGMVAFLKFLHGTAHLPYGIAIIVLTIMVRGCMFPLSRKQAAGAKKMKELQPQIAELKKKYANDKEKFARAQMELFSKHNYNPLAGCLPILLQFPIFIGLYQALRNAVELRMAPFLWIDNLAAPDALFRLPFDLPFLGQDFNILPLLTVGLFLAQQKMFMPPAADEQQAMQQKMMNFMMIFFGFLFYHVPAGLCVYFIASSLWGLTERKMLDFGTSTTEKKPEPAESAPAPPAARKKAEPKVPAGSGRKNLWQRLLEAADQAAQASQSKSNGRSDDARRDKKKKKKSRR